MCRASLTAQCEHQTDREKIRIQRGGAGSDSPNVATFRESPGGSSPTRNYGKRGVMRFVKAHRPVRGYVRATISRTKPPACGVTRSTARPQRLTAVRASRLRWQPPASRTQTGVSQS